MRRSVGILLAVAAVVSVGGPVSGAAAKTVSHKKHKAAPHHAKKKKPTSHKKHAVTKAPSTFAVDGGTITITWNAATLATLQQLNATDPAEGSLTTPTLTQVLGPLSIATPLEGRPATSLNASTGYGTLNGEFDHNGIIIESPGWSFSMEVQSVTIGASSFVTTQTLTQISRQAVTAQGFTLNTAGIKPTVTAHTLTMSNIPLAFTQAGAEAFGGFKAASFTPTTFVAGQVVGTLSFTATN